MVQSTNNTEFKLSGDKNYKDLAIGIDLGGSNCYVGIYIDKQFHIIRNGQGKEATPAYIQFGKDSRLIGQPAYSSAHKNPSNTLYNIKRLLGKKMDDPKLKEIIGRLPYKVIAGHGNKPKVVVERFGEEVAYSPVDLTGDFLKNLKQLAESQCNNNTISNAVITVPASFTHLQRQETYKAACLAGFNQIKIMHQATAASLVYATQMPEDEEYSTILVFNMGGSSIDASIVEIDGNNIKVKASDGDPYCGGADFDNVLVQHAIKEFKKEHGLDIAENPRAMVRLRKEAQKVKEQLSSSNTADFQVECLLNNQDLDITITRQHFEKMSEDIIDNAESILVNLFQSSDTSKKAIDDILICGGTARVPAIQKMLEQFFDGKTYDRKINMDQATVWGASMQAASKFKTKKFDQGCSDKLRQMSIDEVCGLWMSHKVEGSTEMERIFKKNIRVKATEFMKIETTKDNQETVRIEVFQGMHDNEAHLIRDFNLVDIPASEKGTEIDLTYTLDKDGILSVKAAVDDKAINILDNGLKRNRNKKKLGEALGNLVNKSTIEMPIPKQEQPEDDEGEEVQLEEIKIQDVFKKIAQDQKKPVAEYKQYIQELEENQFLSNLQELADLTPEQYKSFGLPEEIEHLLRIKVDTLTKRETPFDFKSALILYQDDYSELRKVSENCSKMADIKQAPKDAEEAKKIAKKMGIPDGEVMAIHNGKTKQVNDYLKKTLKTKLQKAKKDNDANGTESLLFVYCAGHGAADQQQHFILNDSKKQLITIEATLRMLANMTGVKIVSVYDVCRQPLDELKELKRGLGKQPELFGDEYSYCHICTQPGTLVDAESEMAENFTKTMEDRAKADPHSIIEFPRVLTGVPEVEKTINGEAFTIKWQVDN